MVTSVVPSQSVESEARGEVRAGQAGKVEQIRARQGRAACPNGAGLVRSHSEAEDHVQELFIGDRDDAVSVLVMLAKQLSHILGKENKFQLYAILLQLSY